LYKTLASSLFQSKITNCIYNTNDYTGDKQPLVLIFQLPSLISDDMVDYYVRGMREAIMECIWSTFGLSSPSMGKKKPAPVQMAVKKVTYFTFLLCEFFFSPDISLLLHDSSLSLSPIIYFLLLVSIKKIIY
jgi:hypothetical protein